MRKNKMLLTTIACIVVTNTFCQTNDNPVKRKLKITDASIFAGMNFQSVNYGTMLDFQKMASQSLLLNQNMQGYSIPNVGGVSGPFNRNFGYSGNSSLSASIGINFADKEKTKYKSNPKLRIGIVYFSQTSLSNSLYKADRKRYDTLTSVSTGQTVFYDSVTHHHYHMNYNSDQIRIDASLIFRTKPEARWSMYGGIGIEFGTSIRSYTDVTYVEFTTIESTDNNNNNGIVSITSNDHTYKSEQFTNKSNFGCAAYLPMGVDFRMGKKGEFFKRLHLFYELKPFINTTTIPELRTVATVGIMSGLGLRVSF